LTREEKQTLLSADDPPPVHIINPAGTSLFLLLGDHAGNCVPRRLRNLGLDRADLSRHIALDIGVSLLGRHMAKALDATFIEQRYSRLVVDCNRDPSSPESIAAMSDETIIPGNAGLDQRDRQVRQEEILHPYQTAIDAALCTRERHGLRTVLISLHSFTPVLAGKARPWDLGVLHDRDPSFAYRLLAELERSGRTVGDNQPYRMDATDYTIPSHAYPRRLRYAEIEVRQDLLLTEFDVAAMARLLAEALVRSERGKVTPSRA